jgi:HicA toxin of bacterial toxin-antitoxin,
MSQLQKLLLSVLSGQGDQSIAFADLVKLLSRLEFDMRIKGSHHIFTLHGVEEITNIQPNGSRAKPYQVKQVRELIVKYKLHLKGQDHE